MKKTILIIILAITVLVLGFFGWRVFNFYRLIKSGDASSSAVHFQKSYLKFSSKVAPALEKLISPDSPRLGSAAAEINIVEFADFSCEFSAEAFPAIRELAAKYPDKVSLVFRFFPGHSENVNAKNAALASFCAQDQGKFWAYYDKLFQNVGKLELGDLNNYAAQVGLDTAVFDQCLTGKKHEKQFEKDMADGIALGVQGTPTFFVNGEKVEGAIPLEAWERVLGLKL
ncbi:MAG: thioredoxin domain-containing protein [Patescibacteria group bacterium]